MIKQIFGIIVLILAIIILLLLFIAYLLEAISLLKTNEVYKQEKDNVNGLH